jgi:antagonist of KipI
VIVLTGGDFNASLDGVPVPGWTVVGVKHGSTLAVGERRSGGRGYLAVAGGLDVPLVLGSRSTCVRSRIGGLGGRALAKGDELFGGQPGPHACLLIGRSFPDAARPPYRSSPTLRVVLGPQADAFMPEAVEALTHSRYSLSPRSDRMGYRLVGPPLVHTTIADIVSDATPLGAVQVPANQQPILLMADRQTTGGYPKIAVVISADIPLAAQLLPGDTIGFSTVEVAEAQQILREQQRRLAVELPPISP